MAPEPLAKAARPFATVIARFAPSANRIARVESPCPDIGGRRGVSRPPMVPQRRGAVEFSRLLGTCFEMVPGRTPCASTQLQRRNPSASDMDVRSFLLRSPPLLELAEGADELIDHVVGAIAE